MVAGTFVGTGLEDAGVAYANGSEMCIRDRYKTKKGINNALNKEFKDSKRTSEIYSAIKPLIADKKGKW